MVVMGMFTAGVASYDQLPQQVASHWGIDGQADGYSSRFWGAFGLPLLNFAAFIILSVVPLIDPKRANIQKFMDAYDNFLLAFVGFFAYLYGLGLYYNLSQPIHLGAWMIPGLSALFFVGGWLMKRARYNYTIGIRTPWTLADKKVWDQTHRLSGDIYKLAAVFMLAGVFFADQAFWFVMALVIFTTVYSVAYSYYLFRKLHS